MATTLKSLSPVDLVKKLVREGVKARNRFVADSDRNWSMYLGYLDKQYEPGFGLSYFLLNKTQHACIAHAQIQTESKPRVKINPRESGVEPKIYMTRKALATVRALMRDAHIEAVEEETDPVNMVEAAGMNEDVEESDGFAFERLDTEKEKDAFQVDEALVQRVTPLMQPWKSILTGEDMNPVIKPTDIFTVNDAMTARVVQNNCDILWDMDNNQKTLVENVLYTRVYGALGGRYYWDDELMRDCWKNKTPRTYYLPKNCEGIEDADWCLEQDLMDVDEAMEKYPKIIPVIEKNGAQLNDGIMPDPTGEGDWQTPYKLDDFERPMVYVWTLWLRNHRYPMPPDEAITRGRVVQDDKGFWLTDENFAKTTEATDPTKMNWPTRRGIREIQVVCGEETEDAECRYGDIPVVWNRNIPEPHRPWGQGEPYRLEFIQRMIDLTASVIFDNLRYYRSPQEIYPLSVWKAMKPEGLDKIHAHPSRQMKIRDEQFMQYRSFFENGKGFVIEPPKMPTGYVDFLQLLLRIHDELSGNAGVLQGISPGADTSGKAIEDLQTHARGIIGFHAFQTEHMLTRLTKLRIHAMCKNFWLPPFMWAQMNDSFPLEVLKAVIQRAAAMDFNVAVTIASGGGQLAEKEKLQVREDTATGLVSPEYAREVLEYKDKDKNWINPATQPAPAPAAPPPAAAA